MGDRLDLRDFNGVSLSGASSSAAAFAALVAEASTHGITGHLPTGKIVLDGATTPLLRGGAALKGVSAGPDYEQGSSIGRGKIGTHLIIPASANNMVPRLAIHRGSAVANLNVFYPDQTSANGSYDWSNYPTLVGTGPVVYAPWLVMDCKTNDAGGAGVAHGGSTRIENIRMVGFYDGMYLRDPKPDPAIPWTEIFGSGFTSAITSGRDVVDLKLRNICGFGLRHFITLGRVSVLSSIRDLEFTNAYWTEASQEADQPLIKWAQQNAVGVLIQSRWVGGRVSHFNFRQMRYAFKVSGNTPDGVGPQGQDDGRWNQAICTHGYLERVPTLLRVDSDAHLHHIIMQAGLHAADDDDPSATHPLIDIATDRAVAGVFSNSDNSWVPQGDDAGAYAFFNLGIQETAGPVFKNTVNDGHSLFVFDTPFMQRFCLGDETQSAFQNNSQITKLHHASGHALSWSGSGGDKLYDALNAEHVYAAINRHKIGPLVGRDTTGFDYRRQQIRGWR